MSERKTKVLVAKAGLDGHDRGVRFVARALRDAGMEVVYAGLRQTAEMIAEAALQEDVDAVGISLHSAAHMTLFPDILAALERRGLQHVLLTGGGIIPEKDMRALSELGVGRLFPPGATSEEFVAYIRQEVARRRKQREG